MSELSLGGGGGGKSLEKVGLGRDSLSSARYWQVQEDRKSDVLASYFPYFFHAANTSL